MARSVCFRDAVRLLGGRDSKTVIALDKLTGGLLLAASASGLTFALSLFGPRAEFARLSGSLVSGLGERLSGLGRFDRTERLAAAHAVIVVAAYFEVLSSVKLPFDWRQLRLTKDDQVLLAFGKEADARRLRELAAAALAEDIPMPAPQWPYEATLDTLNGYFQNLSALMAAFAAGHALWDELSETSRDRFLFAVRTDVPRRAIRRYEEHFRQLANEFPEMAFWANLVDHQATRAEIRRLTTGLAGVERLLAELTPHKPPAHPLGLTYRAGLDRPVLSTGDVPAGLRIPTLGDAYVNPQFRAVQVIVSDPVSDERWWLNHEVRDDLQSFLVGHLTAPQATRAPLLVLGQPGSGKSLLTQVLAARLAPSEYLVVRVVLREVQAEADLQSHIEQAVRAATGEQLTWPALTHGAGHALPVVLLDGFDELLQATGASQSDYLERVADFQHREAALGRPLVVVVTSRTAVADRTRPADGMVAVRLEPFANSQIAQWLDVWNGVNRSYFTEHGLRPLTVESVAPHADLACQPLLLLMLALYDVDGNALQNHDAALGHAELYERLLARFAAREIGKSGSALSSTAFTQAIDQELLRLAVAAFAMFNRTRQWVTEAELDSDLFALLGTPARNGGASLRAELTAAQLVFGRFFFVHETQAIQHDNRLRTYEFLHPTFGEYLVGRLVTEELQDLVSTAEVTTARSRPSATDDSFLYALLSFAPLTMRGTTVSFIADRLHTLSDAHQWLLRELLLSLLHHALLPRHTSIYGDYRPREVAVPARHATYSANLVVLVVLVTGEVGADDFFPASTDPIDDWRRLTLLWRSQLPDEGWKELIRTLTVHREWNGDQRTLRLVQGNPSNGPTWYPEPYWIHGHYGPADPARPRGEHEGLSWREGTYGYLRKQGRFQCIADDDVVMHALDPLFPQLDVAIFTFVVKHGWKGPVSAAHALITLWVATSRYEDPAELTNAFDVCLHIALHGFAPSDTDQRHQYRALVLRQVVLHRERLSQEWLNTAINDIDDVAHNESDKRLLDLATNCALHRK